MSTRRVGERVIKVPNQSTLHDANAFSLDRRNFDTLDDKAAQIWRSAFLKSKRKSRPQPTRLIIEILNSCNLDCPMCRVGQHGIDYSRSMDIRGFRDVLNQCSHVRSVRLNGLGESTLVPDFSIYIDELNRRSIDIELITNGTATDEIYQQILSYEGKLFFSWDAASSELFEVLRRPASWKTCLGTLQRTCAFKTSAGKGLVGLLFTLQKANVKEFPRVVELAIEAGADNVQLNVVKGGSQRWLESDLEEIIKQIEIASTIAREGEIAIFLPDQIHGREIEGEVQVTSGTHCSAPETEAVIRWNGDVQVCNMFNPYTLGNVFDHGLRHAWESAFAQVFLRKLNTTKCHPYCKKCAYMPKAYD